VNAPLAQGIVHEDTLAGELEPLTDFGQRFFASETLIDHMVLPSDFGTMAKPQILCEM